MGIYTLTCGNCGTAFSWFSGNPMNTMCPSCTNSDKPSDIDLQIAEKVFGWVKVETHLTVEYGLQCKPKTTSTYVGDTKLVSPETWETLKNSPDLYRRMRETFFAFPPPYSKDIATAWSVVDKLAPEQGFFSLSYGTEGYTVYFKSKTASASTAPLAICLAALETYK